MSKGNKQDLLIEFIRRNRKDLVVVRKTSEVVIIRRAYNPITWILSFVVTPKTSKIYQYQGGKIRFLVGPIQDPYLIEKFKVFLG